MREGGILRLYALEWVQTPGSMPSEKLVYKQQFYCSNVMTGVTRRYAALGANRNYNKVLMCWNAQPIDQSVQYAIEEDGTQYRIDIAEPDYDRDSLELTLVKLEDFYDVATETQPSGNGTSEGIS